MRLLRRYGDHPTRQVGSHLRLQSSQRGAVHNITILDHSDLRVGTLSAILTDVAAYLEIERSQLEKEL